MTEQSMKDDELKEKLSKWTKYLDEKNNNLNNIHMDDLKSALKLIQVWPIKILPVVFSGYMEDVSYAVI